jgi:hypothetical protein
LENPSSEKKLRFGKDINCDYIGSVAAFQCPLPLMGGQTWDYQKTSKFHAELEEKRSFKNVLRNVSAIHGVKAFSIGAPLGRVMLRLPGTILLVQLSRAAFMIEIIGKATASDL